MAECMIYDVEAGMNSLWKINIPEDLPWFLHETAAAGLCFLQYCNLNTLRTKFILSISLFLGLSIPQYFREYEVFYVFGPVHTHSPAVREPTQL
jgi:hypothetical protein